MGRICLKNNYKVGAYVVLYLLKLGQGLLITTKQLDKSRNATIETVLKTVFYDSKSRPKEVFHSWSEKGLTLFEDVNQLSRTKTILELIDFVE